MTKTMRNRLLRKAIAEQTKELKVKGFEFEGFGSKDSVIMYNTEEDVAISIAVTIHKEGFDFVDKVEEFTESEKKRLNKAKNPDPVNPFLVEEEQEEQEQEEEE